MTPESGVTASEPKKRGPKSQAEIRAEVEAQVRAELEEQIRSEMQAKAEEERRAAELAREAASEAKPVSGFQISGNPTEDGALTIHFVDDGFTVLGKVWYRGEELTLVPGTPQWDLAPRYRGKMFADLDEFDQEEIWGRRFFRAGPWRGRRITEVEDSDVPLSDAERATLAKAEQIRNERYGVLPRR